MPFVSLRNRRLTTEQWVPGCDDASWQQRSRGARLVILVALLLAPDPASAQVLVSAEYRAKATYLTAFPNFIDWPGNAFLSAQAPFLVCVEGEFRFGTVLAELAGTKASHGRKVEVRWVRQDQEARKCQILFVSESEAKRYSAVLQAVQGRGVLTVGETGDFLNAGGMLSLLFQKGALQFEVNLAAANEAHLRVSSRLLVLARRVLNSPESSKGYITTRRPAER